MALTKLNYNACRFSDGDPVTIRFADAVGEILTAGPIGRFPPLPFKVLYLNYAVRRLAVSLGGRGLFWSKVS